MAKYKVFEDGKWWEITEEADSRVQVETTAPSTIEEYETMINHASTVEEKMKLLIDYLKLKGI